MHAVLAWFGSGTLLKYHAGSGRFASAPPMEAKSLLLPLLSGRPSTADRKAAIFGTSSQSKVMLPILAALASSLVCDEDRHTRPLSASGTRSRDPGPGGARA